MASFMNTPNPTPFGIFDWESDFKAEADSMVTFVKRKLGDDILSVELTNKQIWMNFEEAVFEYGRHINEYQTKSQLGNLLGEQLNIVPGIGPNGAETKYPIETLEFLFKKADAYSSAAGVGGSAEMYSGSINLKENQQDYNIYEEMKIDVNGTLTSVKDVYPGQKLRIWEVSHFSPQAAYRFFDTTSAINYLNNEFAFESFTPETVFYVLPVFEDVLRAQQMNASNRVRRSNYSYQLVGSNLRIMPKPSKDQNLWIKFGLPMSPLQETESSGNIDDVVSNMSNIPFGAIRYSNINSMGRQWIRQYCLALCKETLGYIRTKFSTIPIPGGDLSLNGGDLKSDASSEKEKLTTQLREMLDTLTYDKIIETQATEAENLQRLLKTIPIPMGKVITIG